VERGAAVRLIENTFSQPFAEERFRWFIVNLLNNVDESKAFNWMTGAYIRDSFKDHVKKYRRLGTYTDPDGQKIDVLIVHLKKPQALDRARTTQRNFVATYLKQRGEKDAALVAYHTDDPMNWRFSFVRMEYREEMTPTGKVRVKEEFTAARHSFLVGRNEPSHTAQAQLLPILEDDGRPTIDAVEQAFSVEAVTKQFYLDYRGLFESVRGAVAKLVETDPRVQEEFAAKSIDPANFAKKLLGQIVFLYFLQKKGWLGVGKDEQGNLKPWGTGPKNFLQRLFNKEFADYGNFFNDVLEPLFYEALATERRGDYYSLFNCKIPFLNGGLFEEIHDYNWREIDILLPNDLFQEVFQTFDLYNFTVREDEPLEKEVAVDPEMLGKVFENLLPENLRKGKGTYYTPRPIVHYMCQESLINYLAGECEGIIPKGDIEELVRRGESAVENDAVSIQKRLENKDYKGDYKPIIPDSVIDNAQFLDDKLAGIKVCDPAVGSGAFPVGMMHEIVKARSVLTNYLPDRTGRDTYSLKRHCIQESLYGVDIDPGAIDIAKLRLWLSLIVDEEDYQTINPLPNLDYKIMQGNSLIEEFHGISLDLGKNDSDYPIDNKDAELERLIEELHEKQNAFFNATHPSEKRRGKEAVEEAIIAVFRYRIKQVKKPYYENRKRMERTASDLPENLRDQYLREETEKLNRRLDFDPEAVENELREMTHGNKARNFFPWRLYFADVFRNKGGFDVVIANPPYVRQELISEQKPLLKAAFPDVYQGTADLYVYFYRRALDIARSNGFVTFISSNKFFRAGYGKKLRTYLQENTKLETVIDFGDLPVFEATTYPCVLVISNRAPNTGEDTLRALNVRDIETIEHLPEAARKEGWPQPQRSLRREGWSLEQPEVLALLEKLRKSGTLLGEYVKGKFYRGIVTGLNKAFVIDQATRDRLIAEDPRSAEIIKPWLRGQDVKRWRVDWAGLYVIFTRRGIDIDQYPAVREYLAQFKDRLMPGVPGGRKPGNYKWYEIQDSIDYYAEFEKPKIVWPNLCIAPRFTYDNNKYYVSAPANVLPIAAERFFLLGVLNSAVTSWFMKKTAAERAGDFLEYKPVYVGQVPVPNVTSAQCAAIKPLVLNLLDAEGQGPQVTEWEQELNALVCELYELTEDEIAIINAPDSNQFY